MTRTGKTVTSACEAQHTHRGHDQFARVTVRVEAHEHLGLSVGHALAAAQQPLVDVVLADAQFPLVRSIAGRGEATVRGVRVVADPEDAGLDAPVDWTARWSDIDPIAEHAARDVVAALRDERPPWIEFFLHFGESLSLGRGATRDTLRDAVALALEAARPVERRAARLPLEDPRLPPGWLGALLGVGGVRTDRRRQAGHQGKRRTGVTATAPSPDMPERP
ncbi:MAG: hypothetical protein MUF64_28620 [Polyangiaceae bacterium]|nr:hypothetical protein [Polyangiaceae bacterium]